MNQESGVPSPKSHISLEAGGRTGEGQGYGEDIAGETGAASRPSPWQSSA